MVTRSSLAADSSISVGSNLHLISPSGEQRLISFCFKREIMQGSFGDLFTDIRHSSDFTDEDFFMHVKHD